MKPNSHFKTLKRHVLFASMAAALSLAAAGPSRAATATPTKIPVAATPAMKPAQKCLADLSAFQGQMRQDGYWRSVSNYGYGYPMYGYGYDSNVGMAALTKPDANPTAPASAAYWRARPGYEIRMLFASAQILAQRGQQQPCEALLGTTRSIYDSYASELRSGNVPRDNPESWRHDQLAATLPVTASNMAYRSDQLIGTEVLNPDGETLGSVDDLVLSPKTGHIAYLVIGRGGLFGINEKYVPVPWADFRTTAGVKLLVLNTTKANMAAAPDVKENRFPSADGFDKQSKSVDAYWSAHLAK